MKLEIDGMSCSHCRMRVEKALKAVYGIEEVIVNLDNGMAEVSSTKEIEWNLLREIIEDAGYALKGIEE
ncbi:MAG: heavy-metal-associated domain-containing protein [Kosmotogaceae bacterium]|nr:heavy-metal-associated domain-containing protein [Kosmotogaceae bacterium]